MVYCDKFAPIEKKDAISQFNQLLIEQGKTHEEQVLSIKYPGLQPTEFETPEEGFRLVLESMNRDPPAISGAPVFYLPEAWFLGYLEAKLYSEYSYIES